MLVQSLVLPFLLGAAGALDLDVNSQDSIKSTAKTLASAIVSFYKETIEESLVPGLFDRPYFWWEAGAVFNGLIEYSHLTGDSQFNDIIGEALVHQRGDYDAFMPQNQTKMLANEDQAVWGLAALTAAEVGLPKKNESIEWFDLAKNVFNTMTPRWDEKKCGGGFKWQIFPFSSGYSYKNSMSNANFFLLAARLAQFTGNATYSEWADKSFAWMQDIGLMSEDFSVFDGTDDEMNCTTINHIQWSYPHGLFLEGAAVMYNLTNGDEKWNTRVSGLLESGFVFQDNETSIMTEVACENNGKCNVDHRAFKGIAARSMARAAIAAPFTANDIRKTLQASAKGAAENCDGENEDIACNLIWDSERTSDENANVSEGGLGETFAAMEVVQALLYADAKPNQKLSDQEGAQQSGTGAGANSTATGAAPTEKTGDSGSAAGNIVVSLGAVLLAGTFAVLSS